MTDSLRLFQSEEEYNAVKNDLEYPTVSYVEGGKVYYILQPLATPLYFEALADGMTVTLSRDYISSSAPTLVNNLEYSTDLSTWSALPMNTASTSINTGERIYLRGNAEATADVKGIGNFVISQQCNVGGNIMSLLFNDDFEDKTDLTGYDSAFANLFRYQPIVNATRLILPAITLSKSCYEYMFYMCTSLTTAPELPATTLSVSCYNLMFQGCYNLTTAPELPATTLANYCYKNMFAGCSSLTTAPELPATTLANNCYYGMFDSCRSLTTAPELPATTLASYCYQGMFSGCTSLTTPPLVLPATKLVYECYREMFRNCTSLTTSPEIMCESSPAFIMSNNACDKMFIDCSNLTCIKLLGVYFKSDDFSNWVEGVSPTGTFVKNPALSEETIGRGVSGIPEGWTVIDAE